MLSATLDYQAIRQAVLQLPQKQRLQLIKDAILTLSADELPDTPDFNFDVILNELQLAFTEAGGLTDQESDVFRAEQYALLLHQDLHQMNRAEAEHLEKETMIQTKVKISLGDIYDEIDHVPVIPISIPAMDEIQALAWAAHEKGTALTDEVWGWPVRYEPQVPEPVPHSKLPFRPAVFSIGVYPIWFVAFTWEYGHDQAPTLLVEDENLVTAPPTPAYAQSDAPGYAIRS